MDLDTLKWLLMTGLGIGGFLMKRSINENDTKIKRLETQHDDLNKDLQSTKQNYLHKDDFKEFKIELRQMVEEIRSDIRSLHK